jgi:DNA-binding XRE family transcriptional regulator
MATIIRYQCKTDLKFMRQMLNMSKVEVAEKVFCSIRTIERIEYENATANEETAKLLSDLYRLEFDEQFYVILCLSIGLQYQGVTGGYGHFR